jgi:hypothetical protein
MMRAPLLCPLVGGGDAGSSLTTLGVAGGGADPPDLDADPDDEDDGAILRGVHDFPCRRNMVGATGGGIPSMRELPPSMCASTFSRVRPGPLHQRRRPAVLFRAGGGGGNVVGGEFALVPLPEQVHPGLVVVGEEPLFRALLVAEGDEASD